MREQFGPEISEEIWADMVAQVDEDGDGTVNLLF